MNITKRELLESTEEIKEGVIDYIISTEYRDHRKEYYEQCQKEYEAYEVFTGLISENTIPKKIWFDHSDLLSNESCERSYAHFDLAAITAIDYFLTCLGSESREDEVFKTISDTNKYMLNLFYSPDYDSVKLICERDDSYRQLYEKFYMQNLAFEKILESDPESMEYYRNNYLVKRELTTRISCRDYYFTGCRTVLHVVMDKVLDPWKESF